MSSNTASNIYLNVDPFLLRECLELVHKNTLRHVSHDFVFAFGFKKNEMLKGTELHPQDTTQLEPGHRKGDIKCSAVSDAI